MKHKLRKEIKGEEYGLYVGTASIGGRGGITHTGR